MPADALLLGPLVDGYIRQERRRRGEGRAMHQSDGVLPCIAWTLRTHRYSHTTGTSSDGLEPTDAEKKEDCGLVCTVAGLDVSGTKGL